MIQQQKNNQSQQQDFIRLQDLFWLCVGKWKWFVLSLVVCLGLAVAYLLVTPPQYTRSAAVLVKDDAKAKNSTPDVSGFSDFGLFTSSTNVNNEMGTIQSRDVMREVVKRLHLNYNYSVKGTYHRETLYGDNLPVKIDLKDLTDGETAQVNIQLLGNGRVAITDFVRNDEEVVTNMPVEGKVGETLHSPIGKIVTAKGANFRKSTQLEIRMVRSALQNTTDGYLSALKVTQDDEKSSIIQLSITDVSTQRAEDLLSTLIAVYNEGWVKDKNQIAVSTSSFITERLGVIEDELGHVDNNISSFKSANLVPDVQAAANMYMNQASEAAASVTELRNQVYMANYIKSYLTSEKNRYQLLPANSGIQDPSLAQQINEYNQQLLDRNSLVSQSSTDNPLVVEMDKALTGLRSALVHSVDNQLVSLNTQIRGQQSLGGAATSKIANNPKQSKYLLSVERQQKVKESLYLYLLQKREENELSQAFTAYNTRVITMPGGSMIPTYPVPLNILLVAFAIGLLIPVVVVFVRENMNTAVRGRKDLEKLSVPFVGEIPQHASGEKRKGKHTAPALAVVNRDNGDIINEAFRMVRTNIEFMLTRSEQSHVLMMLSANPGSGKTFICYNLAKSLAIKGKRVCCVDLDMRKASLSQYVGRPKQGVSNYLAGQIDSYESVVVRDTTDNEAILDVIPVGTMPPNPAELLFSDRLATMISQLRTLYDYVFIDCPPAEMVADADIINKHVDDTLFIIRAGMFDRSLLPVVDKYYTDKRYRNMSIILNGTQTVHLYGYKYGYGYGKYGHYGYGYGHYGK